MPQDTCNARLDRIAELAAGLNLPEARRRDIHWLARNAGFRFPESPEPTEGQAVATTTLLRLVVEELRDSVRAEVRRQVQPTPQELLKRAAALRVC